MFWPILKTRIMNKDEKITRNRPAEAGRNNDPDIRDESGQQPGVNTMSSSETDEANQHLTKTAADSFRDEKADPNADPSFDEIERNK